MSTPTAESATPSTPQQKASGWKAEANRLGRKMLESLRRYGGNPDPMRKEHPELDFRRPMTDPGKPPVPKDPEKERKAGKKLRDQMIENLNKWQDHKPRY